VTLAIMGIDGSQEHETGTREIVALPGVQEPLLNALAATGTKLVLVLIGGSAMAIPKWKAKADAIILAGYGPQQHRRLRPIPPTVSCPQVGRRPGRGWRR
jgi:hypothetical protein